MSQSSLESKPASTPNNFQPTPSRFPQTIVTVSRQELIEPVTDYSAVLSSRIEIKRRRRHGPLVKLTIKDAEGNTGSLPNDLQGHF